MSYESSPLRDPSFRAFYFGSIGTALGYAIQATVASWLMATLTPSALMVALVQTASTVPTLLFGLIAGSLADIVDRRRVILMSQLAMLTLGMTLGAATLAGVVSPVALLVLTFLFGCGFTFYLPAQQASINEFVARDQLPAAVALSAVAFNSARAVGPALAGAVTASLGPGSALVTSALLFTGMVVAVRRWKHQEHRLPGVPERLLTGVLSGVRFARHSNAVHSLLTRTLIFCFFASAFWALLPVIARDLLHMEAGGFGLLSAGFGVGAVAGAWALPRLLRRLGLNRIVACATVAWVAAMAVLALAHLAVVALAAVFVAGIAWVSVLSGVSAGVQSSAPPWVRARVVSMNLVACQASLAIGSVLWGWLASEAGIQAALVVSAACMCFASLLSLKVRADMGKEADVLLRGHAPELPIAAEPQPGDGPVLIQVEYQIDPANQSAFLNAIKAVGPTRRRNGARSWRVFLDLEERDRVVERYVVASWADYLRHLGRMTMADARLQEGATQFQRPGVPIRVSRLIGVDAHAALSVVRAS